MKSGRATPMAPDARRQAIVEAVIPLLVSHGAAVTTRQIAEAAGVAEGTIFRVFPDKCALMHAVARETMDPSSGRQALDRIDPSLDLRDTVCEVAVYLLARMEKVIAVMTAVHGALVVPERAGAARPPQVDPPAFIVDANRAMLEYLTQIFERHRDELAVSPERAALILRSLVLGSRHPGMGHAQTLTAEEIATVLVSGVTRAGGEPGC